MGLVLKPLNMFEKHTIDGPRWALPLLCNDKLAVLICYCNRFLVVRRVEIIPIDRRAVNKYNIISILLYRPTVP